MSRLARWTFAALALASLPAAGAPAAHLAATPTSGTEPLVVTFDSARSTAGTIAEHLVLPGNGDALTLGNAEQLTSYSYFLPGFYLAQSWLHDDSGIAVSAPIAISVSRQRDGARPPTAATTVAATTDALTFAFMAAVTPQPGDAIAAARWSFGDGQSSGDSAPFHAYAHPGVYQAAFDATTVSGMVVRARPVVIVGGGGPSLLVTASPEDSSLLTPLTLSAYVLGVTADAKIASASVSWPDLIDASPTLTPTPTGVTLSSRQAIADPGSYEVGVTLQLVGQAAPLTASLPVTVANIDGSQPSPVVLRAPVTTATVGVPYAPDGVGPTGTTLLVAGDGPFAFGVELPSPRNFTIDAMGRVAWTPTADEVGVQRLSLRIVDAQGRQTIERWVVDVGAGKGGCAMASRGSPSPSPSPLSLSPWLLAIALVARRRARAIRQSAKRATA